MSEMRELIHEFVSMLETAMICGASLLTASEWAAELYYADGKWREPPTTSGGTPRLSRSAWRPLRDAVLARDGYVCVYCGDGWDLCADHVVPLSKGGSNEEDNLVCACRPCNTSKSDKLLSEWRGRYQ